MYCLSTVTISPQGLILLKPYDPGRAVSTRDNNRHERGDLIEAEGWDDGNETDGNNRLAKATSLKQ